jgi:hypothetical protein
MTPAQRSRFETLPELTGSRRVLRLERRDLAIEVPQLDAVALIEFTEPLRPSEWRHYYFNELKKVQILRFVELCEQYGYFPQ